MAPQRAGVLTRSASTANRRISRDDLFLDSRSRPGTASAIDRRISRDDLYLDTRLAAGGSSFSTKQNVIQMQRIATLEELSPSFQRLAPPSLPACLSACRGLRESELVGEIQIGMALGSPAHPPASLREAIPPPGPSSPERRWPVRNTSLSGAEVTLSGTACVSGAGTASVPPATSAVPVVPAAHVTPAVSAAATPAAAAPAAAAATAPPPTSGPMHRSKTTRRKLFGLFGGKRHQETTASAKSASATDHESSSPATPEQATSSKGQRTPPNRSNTKKHQPIVIPTPESAGASSTASTPGDKQSRTRPYLRPKASEPIMSQKPGTTHANATSAITSPFLDIEIPDVRLERYSIMFGNLLEPKQPASNSCAWQPASSLLARRQATLDSLKMINEGWSQDDMEQDRDLLAEAAASGVDALLYPPTSLQRRATSPAKSPSFSLFPGRNAIRSPPADNIISPSSVGIAISSPRLRSNTLPTGVDSPQQPYFPQESRPNPLRCNPTHPMVYGAPKRAPIMTAVSHIPRFSYDSNSPASAIMESPICTGLAAPIPSRTPTPSLAPAPSLAPTSSPAPEDSEILQPHTFKPASAELQWQAISPPSTASLSSARSAVSSSGSSTTGNDMAGGISSSIDVAVGESLVPDGKTFPPAVEISIARQISISRQQREMLRPLHAAAAAAASSTSVNKTRNSRNSGAAGSTGSPDSTPTMSPTRSGTTARLGRNERLQEAWSATPTLVLADTTMASGGTQNQHPDTWIKGHQSQNLSPGRMTQNRKSEQSIIEAA